MTSPPRVTLACDFFLRYSAMLAGGLARSGAEVAFLSRDHDLEFGGVSGAAADFTAATTGDSVSRHRLHGRVRSARGWVETMRLRGEMRRFGPEVVHLQESIGNDPRLLVAARARRGRFALTVHDPVRHPGDKESAWIVRANRALVHGAGLIFVHGEALRAELIELANPRAPVVVIPHGIDAGATTPIPDRPSILFFGRLSYYKGLDLLLDAMSEVWQRLPETKLTIAGEGEIDDHPALADPRVDLRLGHVPDAEVSDLIDGAGCVVLPYRQASQSGVGSLAKSHARPLVATAVGALPELVADGSGLLVSPEDPASLAEGLVTVLADRELAHRLGSLGAETASQTASWDVVAARTLDAYRDHLGARG